MRYIDEEILTISDYIDENLDEFDKSTDKSIKTQRGFISQNILGHLRNFVEYIALRIYLGENCQVTLEQKNIESACKNLKKNSKYRYLRKFHDMLQKSISHYTVDKEASERLMLKYYEYLVKAKNLLKREFNLEAFKSLEKFPLNIDKGMRDYYERIASVVDQCRGKSQSIRYTDRFYVHKIKPFFVHNKVYYEVSLSVANSNNSKFDRIIAYTDIDIIDNYAMKFEIYKANIKLFNFMTTILVINGFEISIRQCELQHFSSILNMDKTITTSSKEYKKLMSFITSEKISLRELVEAEDQYYVQTKNMILENTKTSSIFNLLDHCRRLIQENHKGANVLRYLLHNMNNKIIRGQKSDAPCAQLSNLNLNYGCIPFDEMPFCTSLIKHNPKFYDLMNIIPLSGREHELLARFIRNNTEIEGKIFTSREEIEGFEDIDILIKRYNEKLYYKHENRRLKSYKSYVYIDQYADDSKSIINHLQKLSLSGISSYKASVNSWLEREGYSIDDSCKKTALLNMFEKTRVALIYGSAGTGKSTLIKHVSNFFAEKKKLFLANTNSAVENLQGKIPTKNSSFMTIAKFISSKVSKSYDIIFIDECSTVANNDMREILMNSQFELLVVVGDIYQIEALSFGNWFFIAKHLVPNYAITELKEPFRTKSGELLCLWERVRELDSSILESLVKFNFVSRLDNSLFHSSHDDEIILCLNYDGLYGINNVNRLLQSYNPNEEFLWGIHSYKVGDPILFNEASTFTPLINNNSKGKIIDINPTDKYITFSIELDKVLNKLDVAPYNITLIGQSDKGNSIISFNVNKNRSTDEDDPMLDSTIVPFQISYAVSIHKAQGLEYNSVKIVITDDIEDRITHNIFYTAITRSKRYLKIYWSPETEKSILARFSLKNYKKDVNILSNLFSLSKS